MRWVAVLFLSALAMGLSACAPQTDAARTEQEAGGTIPWNRPAQWEGGGVLGSQMNQFSH